MKERKKHYAPIPGLNANNANVTSNLRSSPSPAAIQQPIVSSSIEQNQIKPNNSFSLSSFFGSPLLDKIQNTVLPKSSAETEKRFEQEPEIAAHQISFDNYQASQPIETPPTVNTFYNPNIIDLSQPEYRSEQVPNTKNLFQESYQSTIPSSAVVNSPLQSAPVPFPLQSTFNLSPFQQVSTSNTSEIVANPSNTAFSGYHPPIDTTIKNISSDTALNQAHNLPPLPISPVTTAFAQQPLIPQNQIVAPPLAQTQQTSSYRLRGKPHYKKPTQTADYHTAAAQQINQPINQSAVPFFNPVTSTSTTSVAASTPNIHIFNPLTYDSNQQSYSQDQLCEQEPIAQQSVENISQPPSISLFNPFHQNSAAQEQRIESPSNPIVTRVEEETKISTPITASNISIFNPFSDNQSIETNSVALSQSASPPQLHSFFDQQNIVQQVSSIDLSTSQPTEISNVDSIGTHQLEEYQENTKSPASVANFVAGTPDIAIPTAPFNDNTGFQSNPFHQPNNSNIFGINSYGASNIIADDIISEAQNLDTDKKNNFIEPIKKEETEKESEEVAVIESNTQQNSFLNNNLIEQQFFTNNNNTTNVSDSQIQNFFNNPPLLSEVQEDEQDKNFNFIRTNLLNRRIERIASKSKLQSNDNTESLSVASVIVEPASSAQSEISEYATDITAQSVPESLQSNNPVSVFTIHISQSQLQFYSILSYETTVCIGSSGWYKYIQLVR